jgi:hypothetical protein
MDSYDVRKATNFLVLVCTGYVGLYRGRWEPSRGSQVTAMHIWKILSNLRRGHFGFNYTHI